MALRKTNPKVPHKVVKPTAKDGAAFLTAFGEKGGVWFAQGKTFAEAQTLFHQELQADCKRLKIENDQLRSQLNGMRG